MKTRPNIVVLTILFAACTLVFFSSRTNAGNFDREPDYTYPIDKTPYVPKPFKPRQYVIYRAVDQIVVDGAMNETSWANAEWTNKFDHILSKRGYTKPFLATRAKMLWDDECIYFAAELEEPNLVGHIVRGDTVVCYDSDFEIFIDVDDDAQNYIELEFNVLGTKWDIFYQKEFHRGGIPLGWPSNFYGRPVHYDWDLEGMLIAVRAYGSINYPLDTDSKWTLEASIPWKSLQNKSRTDERLDRRGHYMRVGFSRVHYPWPRDVWPITDWQNKGGGCWDWTWTPNLAYDMHVPENWGKVILSDRTVLDYKDTELDMMFPFVEPPNTKRKPKAGSMVKIKGGKYTIGPDSTDPKDSPKGEVTVKDFYIDRYEVTISEFVEFLNVSGNDKHYMDDMGDPDFCGIVKTKDGAFSVVPGKEYYPIVFMRPESAQAYAEWVGKRLPTEFEWEIAARGKQARLYPWGDEPPDDQHANFNHRIGHTTPVGTYSKGKTPEGVFDMAGNVWELCAEMWDSYPWGSKIDGMPKGMQNMRGGSWVTSPANIGSTYRGAMKYSGWAAMIGFRCAKNAE